MTTQQKSAKNAPAPAARNAKPPVRLARKKSFGAPSAATAATAATAADQEPGKKPILGIPLHLQDKWGYCGAACMMMLLEDAFPDQPLKSQSSLMRAINDWRHRQQKKEHATRKRSPELLPAETRYAWHASPREIEEILNREFKAVTRSLMPAWELPVCRTSGEAIAAATESLKHGAGFIALIWDATLNTKNPHWVVIERLDEEKDSYLVLDPAVTGLPDRVQRYESLTHATKNQGGETDAPLHYCACNVWRDDRQELRAAEKIWIPREKLEELLDEGAARAGGLRYLVVRAAEAPRKGSQGMQRETAEQPFREKVRAKDIRDKARLSQLDEEKPVPVLEGSVEFSSVRPVNPGKRK